MTTPWILAFVALWATVVLLGLIVLGTLRRILPVIERAEARLAVATSAGPGGLTEGASVPPFTVQSIDGETFTEFDLDDTRTVVLFIGTSCVACERLVDDLENGLAPDLGARLVVVSESAESARRLSGSADVTVLVDDDRSVAGAFESQIVPHVFVVEDGTVLASGRPNTWDGMRRLLVGAVEGGGRQSETAAAAAASEA